MLIDSFIKSISSKSDRRRSKTIKQLHRFLSDVHYTPERHLKLFLHDAAAHHKYVKGGKYYSSDWNIKMPDEISRHTQIKLSVPYMVEKFLCFSNCGYLKSQDICKNDTVLFNEVFNSFANAGEFKKTKDDSKFVRRLLFSVFHEQYEVQKRYEMELETFRLLKLYKNFPQVEEWFTQKYGLGFDDFYIICMVFMVLINTQHHPISAIPIKEFISYAKMNNRITDEKIQNFIDYVVIDFEVFVQKYHDLRTTIDNTGVKRKLTYQELQEVDKYIPKVSFLYPLVFNEQKDTMLITSFTSLLMFLRYERIYLDIYHNKDIANFKSRIHGHAVNDYVKTFIKLNIDDSVKLYGDEPYFPRKANNKLSKEEAHAPDVIIEFEEYVIFIECKSKPFDLMKALIHFEEYDFNKIYNEAVKSEKNIDKYLEQVNSYPGKKIYKIVCYFFPNPAMLSIAAAGTYSKISKELIITDIRAIETLFSIKDVPLSTVLYKFLELPQDELGWTSNSLYQFLFDTYENKIDFSTISSVFQRELESLFID